MVTVAFAPILSLTLPLGLCIIESCASMSRSSARLKSRSCSPSTIAFGTFPANKRKNDHCYSDISINNNHDHNSNDHENDMYQGTYYYNNKSNYKVNNNNHNNNNTHDSNNDDEINNNDSSNKNYPRKKSKLQSSSSFPPAWWGNVLLHRTHPHIVSTSSSLSNTCSYPPVHTLILGTHPSLASLSHNEFYGHPLNAFWFLAGDALNFRRSLAVSPSTGKPYRYFYPHLRHGPDKILNYPQQLETLVTKGFALWDILQHCTRVGSLDSGIQGELVPNPIREFCNNDEEGKHIRRIIIANGTSGATFFGRCFRDWWKEGTLVPSEDPLSMREFSKYLTKSTSISNDIVQKRKIQVVCLPGVSPAAAKYTYLQKREAWDSLCFQPGLRDYEQWKKQQQPQSINVIEGNQRIRNLEEPKTQRKSASPSSSPSKVFSAIRLCSSDIAALTPQNEWVDLEVPPEELRPSATLTNGQCFHWMVVSNHRDTKIDTNHVAGQNDIPSEQSSAWGTHNATEWIGPLKDRVYSIRETPTTTLFRVVHGLTVGAKEELQQYFQLETKLAPLYEEWSKADSRLAKIAKAIPGCRILRQDPLECMFSFICSSNNNIPRITKMMASFREMYGTFLIKLPAQDGSEISLYSFPTLASLMDATEEELRNMGLGYRAKFIIGTRDLLLKCKGEEGFLLHLRTIKDSQVVQNELTKFSGIGRKVADCIALFSLDQKDAIPVDIHVQHIASRDYDPTVLGSAKSITPMIYRQVGDLFRTRFPMYAGWAHSLLFVAELPSFRGVLPADVVRDMDEWREYEQRKRQDMKKRKD